MRGWAEITLSIITTYIYTCELFLLLEIKEKSQDRSKSVGATRRRETNIEEVRAETWRETEICSHHLSCLIQPWWKLTVP